MQAAFAHMLLGSSLTAASTSAVHQGTEKKTREKSLPPTVWTCFQKSTGICIFPAPPLSRSACPRA